MKLVLALLTKAGKITKILGYIYTGLLAAESALDIIIKALDVEKAERIKKIMKFITAGADALKRILGWLGKTDVIRDAESEAQNMTAMEFQRKLAIEIRN